MKYSDTYSMYLSLAMTISISSQGPIFSFRSELTGLSWHSGARAASTCHGLLLAGIGGVEVSAARGVLCHVRCCGAWGLRSRTDGEQAADVSEVTQDCQALRDLGQWKWLDCT